MSRDFSSFRPTLGFIPFLTPDPISPILADHPGSSLEPNNPPMTSTAGIVEDSLPDISRIDEVISVVEDNLVPPGPPLGYSTPTGHVSESTAMTDTESEG